MIWTEKALKERYRIYKRILWTPSMLEDLKQMRERGLKHKQIAKLLGLSETQIRYGVQKLKKTLRNDSNKVKKQNN